MWKDGYWIGKLKDGYPESYFDENGKFRFPWDRGELPKETELKGEENANSLFLDKAGSV
jgi:hypothetical protein